MASHDLKRVAIRYEARARCEDCDEFRVSSGSLDQIAARARAHARDTGHESLLYTTHLTRYRRAHA